MGRSTWRSLNSVMLVTLHVAVVATIFRTLGSPPTLAASVGVWLPMTLVVAIGLSWPIGRAIAASIRPEPAPTSGRCRACGNHELRPLLRPGRGLFQPVSGYRCARCGTTHRPVEGRVVLERPASEFVDLGPPGIVFLADSPRPEDREEIRFLDDPADPANIP